MADEIAKKEKVDRGEEGEEGASRIRSEQQ